MPSTTRAADLAVVLIVVCGDVRTHPRAWMQALGLVIFVVIAQRFCRRRESRRGTMFFCRARRSRKRLPADVYRQMTCRVRCAISARATLRPEATGLLAERWFPGSAFCIFGRQHLAQSRTHRARSTALDFDDPVWLRLGFVNDLRYNWTSGQRREARDTRPQVLDGLASLASHDAVVRDDPDCRPVMSAARCAGAAP